MVSQSGLPGGGDPGTLCGVGQKDLSSWPWAHCHRAGGPGGMTT